MEVLLLGALLGGGFYGITKATEFPTTTDTSGAPTSSSIPAGSSNLAANIHGQDARETGFLYNPLNKYSGNLYSYDMKVANQDPNTILKFTKYKDTLSRDHDAFTQSNLAHIFDVNYRQKIPTSNATHVPLIGIPHPGAEVRSGQNVGNYKLLSSNPFTLPEQATSSSKIKNNEGFVLRQTYGGTSQLPYNPNGEAKMSWAGLHNPWRMGGVQYQLHSQYTPKDRDQLTGNVPIANPRNIFDVGGRPTQVTAPAVSKRVANVWNRRVEMGRNH